VHHAGFVYVIGGDNNSGVYQRDVWRAPEDDLTSWTRMCADWGGPGDRVLYSAFALGDALFIASGQTIGEVLETYHADVWRSRDHGATWSSVATFAPLSMHNACSAVVHDGRAWFAGGGQYKNAFGNTVHSTADGITFTAHPSAPFDPRYYNDLCSFDGELWSFGGASSIDEYGATLGGPPGDLFSANRRDVWRTTSGASWSSLGTPPNNTPIPVTHASTLFVLSDAVIFGAGNHLTRQVWELRRL
jgi:hypothetical protein